MAREGIMIGGWPVQFLPVASDLDAEALEHAFDQVIQIDGAMTDKYPDISDILKRMAEGRQRLSKRSFAEKVADIEALRERLAPIKQRRLQPNALKPER
jgi:hypothetical protein